jgi:hypothetical protein
MAKKAYIVLAHKFVPAAGQNTSMKDFGLHGMWEMVEEVFFVTRIRKRWWQEATTIINITDRKIVSNHAETRDYNEVVQHIQIKYAEHYNGFIQECKEGGIINKGS